MTIESAMASELLAIKVMLRSLLTEKIAEYEDEKAAASQLASICSDAVNETVLVGPEANEVKVKALQHLDQLFANLTEPRSRQ
jgi:hypothetical protein